MHHSALAPAIEPTGRPNPMTRPMPRTAPPEAESLPTAASSIARTVPADTDSVARTVPADTDSVARTVPAVADSVAVIAETANPDPATLCANLARCAVEILSGARPLDQIGRWVSDSVYVHLLRRTMLAARLRAVSPGDTLRPRMRIGDPHLTAPSEGVVEAVVLVHQPARSRAVAIRLERHRERWRASAINVL
ncbi:Rv3235 family protein [Leifsonia sp. SIMBA_070]|uniref:Rv3235 family protein n=1 Tax=Leifsonia sp. SIMBA_070 TaxID=3085810 RepID=UPI0039797A43